MGSCSIRGQAFAEYVLVLAGVATMSYVAVRVFPPALGAYYRHLCTTRAGLTGMLR